MYFISRSITYKQHLFNNQLGWKAENNCKHFYSKYLTEYAKNRETCDAGAKVEGFFDLIFFCWKTIFLLCLNSKLKRKNKKKISYKMKTGRSVLLIKLGVESRF